MASSVLTRTEPQRGLTERIRRIREWIVALVENFGTDLSVARIDLLEAGLADLSLEDIHKAFQSCALRHERFFPSLKELRNYMNGGVKRTSDSIEDELSWQKVLRHCREHVRPHLGQSGPPLSPALDFAARVAGGLAFLESCSEQNLIFAKQRFEEALVRWREGVENFEQLPEGPAKQMIAAAAKQKALPMPNQKRKTLTLST